MIDVIGKLKRQGPRFENWNTLEDLVSVCSCCENIQYGEKSR